jgi:glycerate dehydrogenase
MSAAVSDASAVFLDYATMGPGDVNAALLRACLPNLNILEDTHQQEIAARIEAATFVFTNKLRIGAREMASAPALRFIGVAATGIDNVDLGAARERGIAVCNIRDYCTQSVAQHVIAMMLSLTQQLAGHHREVSTGGWGRSGQFCLFDYPIRELSGRSFGVVGYGVLGRATARVAEALGMRILISARADGADPVPPGRIAFRELLREADVISLHCPLTPQTRGLIGAAELAQMKSDALLINTARGALIDAQALADALRERRIGGAGIDVLEQEPPVDGSSLLELALDSLILTPHVAWAAREARQRAIDEIAANVAAFIAGERRNRVD